MGWSLLPAGTLRKRWDVLRGCRYPSYNSKGQSALHHDLNFFSTREPRVYKELADQRGICVDFFRYSQRGLDRARQACWSHLHGIPGYCMFSEQETLP